MKIGIEWVALFAVLFTGCILDEKKADPIPEKNTYAYAGKISGLQFVINSDSAIRCYKLRVARAISVGGTGHNPARWDTIMISSCEPTTDYYILLDTVYEDSTRHILFGTFYKKWAAPASDSGWVKQLTLTGDSKRKLYSNEFIPNQLNIYAYFDYFGDTKGYRTPTYFDSVSYVVTLIKPEK